MSQLGSSGDTPTKCHYYYCYAIQAQCAPIFLLLCCATILLAVVLFTKLFKLKCHKNKGTLNEAKSWLDKCFHLKWSYFKFGNYRSWNNCRPPQYWTIGWIFARKYLVYIWFQVRSSFVPKEKRENKSIIQMMQSFTINCLNMHHNNWKYTNTDNKYFVLVLNVNTILVIWVWYHLKIQIN